MTAYVLDGLLQCERYSVSVPKALIEGTARYLLARYKEEKDLHMLAYEAYVLSEVPVRRGDILPRIDARLWGEREQLSGYRKALLALTFLNVGQKPIEDMKPAGFEPVELTSGGEYGARIYANRETRDTKVAFFLDSLPQGSHSLTYQMVAEVPGLFHTLPANILAVYAPTVRATSDEIRMGNRDKGMDNRK